MKLMLVAAIVIGGILASQAQQAVITTSPQSITINAGSAADFTVVAPNATGYQWEYAGASIDGATNSELNIQNVATNQAGTYTVVVSSAGSNVTSSATLSVLQGTIINFRISAFADGSSSNVLVELFDHDKPATVQNFLHYVLSGSYSNIFFERLLPGFIIQGGDYFTTNRTDPNPFFHSNTFSVFDTYVTGSEKPTPPLANQVDNEFFVGPTVSNTAGTLALALPSGNNDGGANAFFFNLVDNPFLDVNENNQGPFTVFGRVIGGMEVLQYFNNSTNFSKPSTSTTPTNNIFTNGIWDETYLSSSPTFTDLPINDYSTNLPTASNLFYIDFSFPVTYAQPVVDTNPPTGLTITYPTNNSLFTNGYEFTIAGTAHDDVGLAYVFAQLQPENGANGGTALTGYVTGTTNWQINTGTLEPGIYGLIMSDQDGAGNIGVPASVSNVFTITAVLIAGNGAVTVTNADSGTALGNAVGANLLPGTNYIFAAQPGPGQVFYEWTYGTNVSYGRLLTNVMASADTVYTATFISTNGVILTYPAAGGNTSNGLFNFQGRVNPVLVPPVTVTLRLYSATNQQEIGLTLLTTTANIWSFPVTNLTPRHASLGLGNYYEVVTAQDAAGQETSLTNYFSAGLPLRLSTAGNGQGSFSSVTNGQFLVQGQSYNVTATPTRGSSFVSWNNGIDYSDVPTLSFISEPGLAFTATFISNDITGTPITITYPASSAQLTNHTFTVTGTLSPALTNPVVSYQLFENSNSVVPLSSTNVVLGPTGSTWSAGVTNLSPGYYTLVAAVSDVHGRSATVSRTFQILARVTLQVFPAGAGTISSNWTGSFLSVGATSVRHLAAPNTNGGYVFAYWTNSLGQLFPDPLLSFNVTTDTTIAAIFDTNYFYRVAGTYNGLFFPVGTNTVFDPINTVISPTNAGGYTFTVTPFGLLYVTLSFPTTNLTSQGYFPLFNPSGTASATFSWNGLDGKPVTNHVNLYLHNGVQYLDGDVSNAKFSSYLLAFRAMTNARANSLFTPGTNVLFMAGDHAAANNHPGGDSYATFTLRTNGLIALAGFLADNTSFSVGTGIASEYYGTASASYTNSLWPVFAPLYRGGTGMVLGWMTNSSPSNFTGAITWSKPARTGSYYTNAFFLFTNASSALYVPPVARTHYQIVFGGASLTNEITNTLTVGTNGQFTVDAGPTNHLTLTLTRNNGTLTGSFSYPRGTVIHALSGAFASPTQGGSGYFLDTNSETGFFEITPFVPAVPARAAGE